MKKNNKKWWILSSVICILLIFGIFVWKNNTKSSKGTYAINYTVKTESASSGIVEVKMKIIPDKNDTELFFQIPEIETSEPKCITKSGKDVGVEETGGIWKIEKLKKEEPFTFTYNVRIGSDADTSDATVCGAFYEDLLAFQGSQVLALPCVGQEEASKIEQSVSKLTFTLDTEYDWNSIMPFTEENSKKFSFTKENPDWNVFNEIYYSAFCFGDFEQLTIDKQEKNNFYIDKAIVNTADMNDLDTVRIFYEYYKKLFNGKTPKSPVVLLRTDEENNIILGGTGAGGTALTLEMKEAKDCERMSRTLYHAFFDSLNRQENLRYAPNLWLYDGLADFYSEDSALELSDSLRAEYGISMQDNLLTRYGKYLYYMLNDQSVSSASPEIEGQMSVLQNDFYYELKVPLIIASIETFGKEKSEDPSVLISYLIEHGNEKELDLNDFNETVLGKNEEAVKQYLTGESFIPNYWGLNDNVLGDNGILTVINERESRYVDEYEQQNMTYPCPSFELIDREKMDAEIKKRDLTFGNKELEQLVKDYSENLYYWCMQAVLRAELCDVEDLTTPQGKAILYSEDGEKIWREYCDKHF